MSKKLQKIIIIVSCFLLIALIFFLIFIILRRDKNNDQPIETVNSPLELEKRLPYSPPTPTEPANVLAYAGQIKKLELEKNQLVIATVYGDKIVSFDANTTIQRTNNLPEDRQWTAEELRNALQNIQITDLSVGDVVTVSSLTNIQGSVNFKASSIVLSK